MHQYAFREGLPAERVTRVDGDGQVTTVRYAGGRPYDIRRQDADQTAVSADYFQYANGDDYFTMVLPDWQSIRHMEPAEGV